MTEIVDLGGYLGPDENPTYCLQPGWADLADAWLARAGADPPGWVYECPRCPALHLAADRGHARDSGRWLAVCGTGHRGVAPDQRRWLADKLYAIAVWLRDAYGTRVGVSGMAYGYDLMWANAIVRAKLILGAYSVGNQTAAWKSPAAKREWRRLMDLADPAYSKVFGVQPDSVTLNDRNIGMITDTDAVICGYEPPRRGGTFNAIREAHQQRAPGVFVDLVNQTVQPGLPPIPGTRPVPATYHRKAVR